MAFDPELAERIRRILAEQPGMVEKKMFGGIAFLLHGNMACGVHASRLIVRLGAERYATAMTQAHTAPFDLTGKPMAGWLMVDAEGCATDADLQRWVQMGLDTALSLPTK